MLRHNKLVLASMLYIDITLVMPGDPHFSFDKSVPLPNCLCLAEIKVIFVIFICPFHSI